MAPAEQIASLIGKACAQLCKKLGSAGQSKTTKAVQLGAVITSCPTCLKGTAMWGQTPAEPEEQKPTQAATTATGNQPKQKICFRCMHYMQLRLDPEFTHNQEKALEGQRRRRKQACDGLKELLKMSTVSSKQKRAWEESEHWMEVRYQNMRTMKCRWVGQMELDGDRRPLGKQTLQLPLGRA